MENNLESNEHQKIENAVESINEIVKEFQDSLDKSSVKIASKLTETPDPPKSETMLRDKSQTDLLIVNSTFKKTLKASNYNMLDEGPMAINIWYGDDAGTDRENTLFILLSMSGNMGLVLTKVSVSSLSPYQCWNDSVRLATMDLTQKAIEDARNEDYRPHIVSKEFLQGLGDCVTPDDIVEANRDNLGIGFNIV